jgi:hypothetical protein
MIAPVIQRCGMGSEAMKDASGRGTIPHTPITACTRSASWVTSAAATTAPMEWATTP